MKRFFIYSLITFVILIVINITLNIISSYKKVSTANPPIIITPTGIIIQANQQYVSGRKISLILASPSNPLKIISTNPSDSTTNIPVDQMIILEFNKAIEDKNNISIITLPPFPYSSSISDHTLTLMPTQPLSPNTTYFLYITIQKNTSYSFSFQTIAGPLQQVPDYASQIEFENTKMTNPNQFLNAYVPYTSKTFSIEANNQQSIPTTVYFSVSFFSSQGNADLITWLLSLGLTASEIKQLNLLYR